MINKRGIGNVIATVLLILIAIAAVALVWTFISVVITDTTEDIATAPAQLSPALNIEAVNKDENSLLVKRELGIGKTGDVKVIGLKVVLEKQDGSTEVIERDIEIEKLETKKILDIRIGDDIVIVYVYPFFEDAEGETFLGAVPGVFVIEDDVILN